MLKKTLILIFLLINLPVQAFSLTFDMEVIPNPISDRGGYAYDINNSGQIAVQFITDNGERRSFLYQNGLTTDLGSLRDDYPYNKVYGLNENGQAVGGSPGYPYGYRAYSYENGSLMNLGTLYSNDDGSEARAVNNHSQIVGNSGGRAFLYDNGVMIDILGNYGSAFDINDSGQIVGSFLTPGSSTIQHAYIYENGSLNDLGTLGGPHSWAYGINEMGEVVGGSYMNNVDDEYHAFLYSGGSMLDLGTLGGRQSTAWGVNNRGWVVGDSETTNGEWHGFLWINGVMHDLGTLGGSNSRAYAANDSGDIVGFAMTDTSTHTNEKLAVHWKVVPILSEYNVFTLTNNSHHDWYPHLNDIGSASWISGTGVNGNWYNQVYLYESGSIKIISIDNSYYNSPPIINNNNQVVWSATRGTEGEMYNKAVFFYDGYQTLKLFEYVDDRNIQVDLNNNGFVVWNRLNGTSRDVYLYDGTNITNVSNSSYMSWEPTINDRGEIAWQELGEIWKYDGLNSNKISAGNGGNHNLYMNNNGDVVWMGSGNDLWIFDGLLTSNFTNSPDIYENFPKINDNGQIIYEGHASGQNTNVYFYDGITHKNISNSSYGAGSAQINNDNLIVWNGTNENGDMEIYLSDVSEVINLSNNPNGADQRPFINENGEIIWMGYDGNDFEVLIAKPVSCFIKVTIDIKPGSYPNYINNNGHGVIPVAILGSVDFDCTQVDPETVSLEGLGIKMVGKSNKFLAHYEDINHDGYDDLVLKIEDTDAVFQEGQTTATLSGNLYEEYGGAEIEGTDTICIVP